MNLSKQPGSRDWGILMPLAIAAVALLGVVGIQRLHLDRPLADSDPQQTERQESWRLKLVKQSPAFGFDNLIADWTFLNFLQYYGDTEVRQKVGYSLSPAYFELITQRDPRFVNSYLFLSSSISYQLGQPEVAVRLMDRGTAALSPQIDANAFLVWRFKGLDQLLLLGDVPGAIHSHEMAAQWVVGTPSENLVPLFQQVANFLRRDPNSRLVRFQAWTSVYEQAIAVKDKPTQERAKREILAIGGKARINKGQLEFVLPALPAKPSKAP